MTGEVGLHYTDVRRSLGAVDDEKGMTWSLRLPGQPRERRRSRRRSAARSISASRSRCRTRRSGCAARPAPPTATATTPSPISTSAASATTMSTTESIKRYREYDSLPGLRTRRDQRAQFRARDGRVEPAARRLRVGRHAELLPDLAAARGLRRRPVDEPAATRRCARITRASAAQADLRFSVLHWYDMTLSVGYAVGFQGGQRTGTEWMLSLKIM